MSEAVQWANVRVRLGDLAPWPRNPRRIGEREAGRLAESWDEFGQVETIAVGPDDGSGKLPVYNGHQRLSVLLKLHGEDYEVDARQSSRALTEKEREKLTAYLHRGAVGDWDWDLLTGEFDAKELLDWGFDEQELGLGKNRLDPDFEEFDESVADEVETATCPNCGHNFPI